MCVSNNLSARAAKYVESDPVPAINIVKSATVKNFMPVNNVFENDTVKFGSPKTENPAVFNQQKIIDIIRGSAQKSTEQISQTIAGLTAVLPFVGDSADNGNIHADLKVGVVDNNGFLDYGNQDLNVTLNGKINVKKDVFFKSLQSIENMPIQKSWYADINIGKVSFDAKNKSYKIQLKVDGPGPINDNMNFVIKTDNDKNLVMSVEDKWLPITDKYVLKKVQSAVQNKLKDQKFGLETKIVDNKLYFLPQVKNQEIKLSTKESLRIDKNNIDFKNTNFNIDQDGNVEIGLNNVSVTGSNLGKDANGNNIPEKSAGDVDSAEVEFSADIDPKGSKVISIKAGRVSTNLDEKESDVIKIQNSNLGRHFNNADLKVDNLNGKISLDKNNKVTSNLGAKISISLSRPNKTIGLAGNFATNFNSAGDFSIASKDLTISHPDGISKVKDFFVADDQDGLKLNIIEEPKPLPPVRSKQTNNDLKALIGPQNYVDKLFPALEKAKESINIESYLYSGNIARDVTDKLLAKAGGITQKGNYNVKIDNPQGVKVKVIFDSSTGDETEETHESVKLVKERYNQFVNDVSNGNGKYASLSKGDRVKVVENVKNNMNWKMLQGGITEIDHRKEVIIDGQTAFSGGGINFTDSALRKHDMMVNVWGPAVNQIQNEFIQNWEEVAGKIPDSEKAKLLKDDKELTKIMKEHQKETGSKETSKTQVLVTDDNQFEVYQKLSEQLKTAKNINIEHAYFTDKKLVQEVAAAIKRGANVNVILPEESDEGDKLNYGNIGTMQQLKKASEEPGAGKFNAYLYKWNEQDKTGQFTHTKAVTFDGKTAFVGSTNLTARSLHGTVTGFLFNKELSLMVDDKNFVSDLNKNLFEKDMKPEFSKKLDDQWFKDIAREQKKIDKYTAIQPLF